MNFNSITFKNKKCSNCLKIFRPKSGVHKYCSICKTTCQRCGSLVKSRSVRQGCKKCLYKYRVYILNCNKCKRNFEAKIQHQNQCWECNPKIKCCIDCNKQLSSNKKTRCNRCRALYALKTKGLTKGFAKKIYRYKKGKYRSTWEVDFVKRLDILKIKFEYEKRYEETGGYPDFYLPEFNFYIEIHPDYFGKKTNLPKNCILVKTKNEIDVLFVLLYNMKYGRSRKIFSSFTNRQLKSFLNSIEKIKNNWNKI